MVTIADFRKRMKELMESGDVIEITQRGRVIGKFVPSSFSPPNALKEMGRVVAVPREEIMPEHIDLDTGEILEEKREFYNSESGEMEPLTFKQVLDRVGTKHALEEWNKGK